MNKITPQAYNEELKQELKDTSWLIIDNSTENGIKIFYFNNDDAPEDYKLDSFKEFFELYLDDNFSKFDETERHINDTKASATGSSSEEDEDFDEDSGRSWKIIVTKAQVIDGFNSIKGLNLDNLIKESKQNLDNIECDSRDREADSISYRKDPYAYYGVSRKDFL